MYTVYNANNIIVLLYMYIMFIVVMTIAWIITLDWFSHNVITIIIVCIVTTGTLTHVHVFTRVNLVRLNLSVLFEKGRLKTIEVVC